MMKPVTSAAFVALVWFTIPALVSAMPLDLVTRKLPNENQVAALADKLPQAAKTPNTEAFCAALADTKSKLNAAVELKEGAVAEYLAALPEDLENGRNGRDAKLEEARSEADQLRSEWYARLKDRAEGDDEEDAVVRYQKRVEEAVDDRRDAIDAAIAEFRTSTDALVVGRTTGITSARDAFTAAVAAAAEKLETDCLNGVATVTVVKSFKTSLAAARTKLIADKQAAQSVQEAMQALSLARKKSIAAAVSAFQTELAAANAELRAALADEK